MNVAAEVGAGAGAALLLTAGGWRLASGRRARRMVTRALHSDSPSDRRAGLALAAQQGVAHHFDDLVDLSRTEEDPSVQVELARVVERSQWMPPDERMVELRLWAQGVLEKHGASVTEGPGGAGPAGGTAAGGGPGGPASGGPASGGPASGGPASGGPAQADTRLAIFVTGAGGPAGVSVIRALRRIGGYRVVAADADEWAAGLQLADEGVVVPRADDPDFAVRLQEAVAKAKVDVLVSTVAEEMLLIRRRLSQFTGLNVAMWLPTAEALGRCLDKLAFARALQEAGVPTPATGDASAEGVPGPWIVKPRFGRGSRDVERADTEAELGWALYRVPTPIVQTRLSGREFTVDVLADRTCRVLAAVPRWRVQTKAGISTQGLTFEDPAVTGAVEATIAAVRMEGPANVQGFVDDAGGATITEVNPRFSGGLPLSLHAGADLVGQYVRGILGLEIDREALHFRTGVRMTRYFDEIFEE